MRKAFRIQILVVLFRYLRQHGSHIFRSDTYSACTPVNGRTKRHGTAHHVRVGIPCAVVIALYHLRQSVNYADELGRVVKIQFRGRVGDIASDVFRHIVLSDGKDKHLVVGQQPVLYGVGEIHAVELLPVQSLIVHRTEDAVLFRCLYLGRFPVQPWRSGHVKPFTALHIVVGVYLGKIALVLVRQLHACSAVGFVADDEIEHAILAVCFGKNLLLCR